MFYKHFLYEYKIFKITPRMKGFNEKPRDTQGNAVALAFYSFLTFV